MERKISYPLHILHPAVTELYPKEEIIYHNGGSSFKVTGVLDETGQYKLQPVDANGRNLKGHPRLKTDPASVEVYSYDIADEL